MASPTWKEQSNLFMTENHSLSLGGVVSHPGPFAFGCNQPQFMLKVACWRNEQNHIVCKKQKRNSGLRTQLPSTHLAVCHRGDFWLPVQPIAVISGAPKKNPFQLFNYISIFSCPAQDRAKHCFPFKSCQTVHQRFLEFNLDNHQGCSPSCHLVRYWVLETPRSTKTGGPPSAPMWWCSSPPGNKRLHYPPHGDWLTALLLSSPSCPRHAVASLMFRLQGWSLIYSLRWSGALMNHLMLDIISSNKPVLPCEIQG